MDALQFDMVTTWGVDDLSGRHADLHLVASLDVVEVSSFLEGLYRTCRERFDPDTCHEILDDTHTLLADAGYCSWQSIGRQELADVILRSTRDWEYVGESGTIDVVRAQRDYTRTVVGEECFLNWYRDMQTLDGQSYFVAVQ